MKKICLILCISISLIILISASVWEGSAAAAAGGELPESGLYIATNSFPVNTVVDVTNLENGKTIRVIATSGLDAPGLLAVLSRDAASAIGLPGRSLGRIRMSQSSDPVAFPRVNEGRASSGDPDFDPAAFVALNGYAKSAESGKTTETENIWNRRAEGGDIIVDMPADTEVVAAAEPEIPRHEIAEPKMLRPEAARPERPEYGFTEAPAAPFGFFPPFVLNQPEAPYRPERPEIPGPDYNLSLVPSEARPPESSVEPDPAYIIPSISPRQDSPSTDYLSDYTPDYPRDNTSGYLSDYIDLSLFVDPVNEAPLAHQPAGFPGLIEPVSGTTFVPSDSIFSAPLISCLEKGKYYLQIAAYSKEETVRSEISKIDNNLPVAVMNAGNPEKPVYRILIGPVNLGESGALLQRFKVSHKDAFVRLGN